MKQKTNREVSQNNNSARKEFGAWKLTEIFICYSNKYATDITDILDKTIFQKVP